MKHSYSLFHINTRMRMLIWNAREAFVDAVEFVDLSKSCMKDADVALHLIQFPVSVVDILE